MLLPEPMACLVGRSPFNGCRQHLEWSECNESHLSKVGHPFLLLTTLIVWTFSHPLLDNFYQPLQLNIYLFEDRQQGGILEPVKHPHTILNLILCSMALTRTDLRGIFCTFDAGTFSGKRVISPSDSTR